MIERKRVKSRQIDREREQSAKKNERGCKFQNEGRKAQSKG